jgi:hypothetical protein
MQYILGMTKTNRLLVIFNTLLATILVLVLIQFAPSVANANSKTIVACANKKTGDLRIAYKKCTKDENKVRWGKTGAKGATGAKGDTGAQGPAGPQGPAGSSSSGGASGMILQDANGVAVSNIVDVDSYYVLVMNNNRFFTYRDENLSGNFSGKPLGRSFTDNLFLTPGCNGPLVFPIAYGTNPREQTYTPATLDPTIGKHVYGNGVYQIGNELSASAVDLYLKNLVSDTCTLYSNDKYYESVEIPSSEIPPTLASPIRITFN